MYHYLLSPLTSCAQNCRMSKVDGPLETTCPMFPRLPQGCESIGLLAYKYEFWDPIPFLLH